MKNLISVSLIAMAAMAMAQPPAKTGNMPADTMSSSMYSTDTLVTSPDSTMYSNQMYTDTSNYKMNDQVNKKEYKRTTSTSVRKSSQKSSASNKSKK